LITLALRGRWIGNREVEVGYDTLADDYSENWLTHLSAVTDLLLENVMTSGASRILDLGCGTGYSTQNLASRHPHASIIAQDISHGMLEVARSLCNAGNITLEQSDMLDFLKQQPDCSSDLILSAWAIGYSNPGKVLKESFRTLVPGGRFAYVVNLMNTLRPVYIAFRKTMQRHPDKLEALSVPRFPKTWDQMRSKAERIGFETNWSKQGKVKIAKASDTSLQWLSKTGILAGFDAMLPLSSDQDVARCFENYLREQKEDLAHHYIMAILEKPDE
jgi:trans-aconitate methyltransferase